MVKVFLPTVAAVSASAASVAALTAADVTPDIATNFGNVELAAGPTCAQDLDSTLAAVQAAGCSLRTRVDTSLYCGLSFGCAEDIAATTIVAGLKTNIINSYPVTRRTAPQTVNDAIRPDAAPVELIHTITGVNDARNKLGLTGKGIKVAVLDSGVYYKHPALGGCFGQGCKVAFGYDLVGDTYGLANQTVVPDNDPLDDCSGNSHGTHVAGIIGGVALNITTPGFVPQVPWTGVAPDVTLGAYRIFGCPSDNTFDDIISAAVYKAAADGADVINMSIGGGPSLPDQADASAVARVSAAGVIVVASNGNDGAQGYMVSGNPAGSLGGFGVASFDNLATPQFALSVDSVYFPWSAGVTNSSFAEPTESLDIFVNNPNAVKNDVQDDGCSSVGAGAKGKTVLLRWGSGCGSRARCTTAQNAGAKNCLIYSNTDSIVSITGGFIPSASTSNAAGAAILASATKKVVIGKQYQQFPIATGGTVSSFSSGGLDAELHIKPEIGGIGGQVYSTISPHAATNQGFPVPYASYSGTSMASPYFAGTVALYLQSRGKTSFEKARVDFQNSATPTNMYKSDLVASVALQGAGLVNVYNALLSKTVVTPSFLALNDTQFTSKTHYTITLQNNYRTAVSYTVTNVGAATVNMYNGKEDFIQPVGTTTFTKNYASLGFGNKQEAVFTTVVPAGGSTQINVKVTQPSDNGLPYPIFSGYIKVTNNVDDSAVNVPYAGLVGNWKEAPILSVKGTGSYGYASGFYLGSVGKPIPAGSVVNLSKTSIVVAPIYGATTRLSYVEVVYAGTNQTVKDQLNKLGVGHNRNQGYAALSATSNGPIDLVPYGVGQRNSPAGGQGVPKPWVENWNGKVLVDPNTKGPFLTLPAGDYKLRLKAMHHMTPGRYLGDDNYEIIESPVITIAY